jgi:Zn-dependent protease with chaperone function
MNNNNDKQGPKSYRSLSDTFKVAASATAAYVPYVALLSYAAGTQQTVENLAIISGIFLALRTPYIREVPVALTKLLMKALMRGQKDAPERITGILEDLSKKADIKTPSARTYSKGMTNNAAALTNQIYVGEELMDKMDDDELRFVLAHELSHIKTKDVSEIYLHWPPFVNSFLVLANTLTMAISGAAPIAVPLMGYLYFKAQSSLQKFSTRTIEYRADRNAIQLTGDLPAAITGLSKIAGEKFLKMPHPIETFEASHPQNGKRIIGLCEAFNEQSGKDKNEALTVELKKGPCAGTTIHYKDGKYTTTQAPMLEF